MNQEEPAISAPQPPSHGEAPLLPRACEAARSRRRRKRDPNAWMSQICGSYYTIICYTLLYSCILYHIIVYHISVILHYIMLHFLCGSWTLLELSRAAGQRVV